MIETQSVARGWLSRIWHVVSRAEKAEREAEKKLRGELMVEASRKHPVEIVIHALLIGQEIELESRQLIFKLFDGKKLLMKRKGSSKMELGTGKVTKEPWFAADVQLSQFIRMCESLDKDYLIVLGANSALNEIKREGAPQRA